MIFYIVALIAIYYSYPTFYTQEDSLFFSIYMDPHAGHVNMPINILSGTWKISLLGAMLATWRYGPGFQARWGEAGGRNDYCLYRTEYSEIEDKEWVA
ncbi:uncharacterized protein GGS25DRAFT_506653 [Hypoxylon fragiforme]|uniref:uncharacterized protein n=1 Tax=Hypoxylon fragiforme TaxID=63214 RepID=UPI0020C71A9F|nr:uncharacterized protein GGS25DRAFT_506653 [Hypoxylon fragiforme]KAI2604051.1 hypothetical protein GGS25DRAFT_506653 [Hypoxylon fragiforme]